MNRVVDRSCMPTTSLPIESSLFPKSMRYEIPAAVHVLDRVCSCSYVLFRAFFKHKSQDASAETILRPHNSTVQPLRDRRIEGKLLGWALIPKVWNLHFLLDPAFSPMHNRRQEVGDSRPDNTHNHMIL